MSNKKNYNKMFTNENKKSPQGLRSSITIVDEKATEVVPKEIIEQMEAEKKPLLGTITNCNQVNFRKKPDKSGEIICVLDSGTKVEIEEIVGDWAHIYTSNGMEGYVMKGFIKEE